MREKSNKSALASAGTRNYSHARRIQGRFRVGQRGAKTDTPIAPPLRENDPRSHQGRDHKDGHFRPEAYHAGDAAHRAEDRWCVPVEAGCGRHGRPDSRVLLRAVVDGGEVPTTREHDGNRARSPDQLRGARAV